MCKYKYLLFDLDDTLLDFKKAEYYGIKAVFEKMGITVSDENIELYSKINLSCWKQYEQGEITREDIYKNRVVQFGEKIGVDIDVEEFSDTYFYTLSRQGQTMPYAFELMDALSKKDYVIAAATNGALVPQTFRIVNSGLAGFFKGGIFVSEQIGFRKPEPEFFEYLLKELRVKDKGEVLVIGDSLSSDIAGAVSLGLDSCFVNLRSEEVSYKGDFTYSVCSLKDLIKVCGL